MFVQRADDAVSRRKKTDENSPDDRGGWVASGGCVRERHTHTHQFTCCPYT